MMTRSLAIVLLVFAFSATVQAHDVVKEPATTVQVEGKDLLERTGEQKHLLSSSHDKQHHGLQDAQHHHDGSHSHDHHHEKESSQENHGHDHDHDHGRETHANRTHFLPCNTGWGVWTEAIIATVLVGAAPILILTFIPVGQQGENGDNHESLLKTLLAFAAGGLLGDSFLHLLPHAIESSFHHHHDHHDHHHGDNDHHEGHSHSLSDLAPWLWTVSGIISFWLLEKVVRQLSGDEGHGHGHSHGARSRKKDKDSDSESEEKTEKDGSTSTSSSVRRRSGKSSSKSSGTPNMDSRKDNPSEAGEEDKGKRKIAVAGYLNLAADFSHNFTDGLALGATFLQGKGLSTTLAILFHEVPHEIGDFAILIQSGFSRKQAMWAQLWTAMGCLVGTLLGLAAGEVGGSAASWISPFTAGGFMYIATVTVLPELLSDSSSLIQTATEFAAMVLGIGLMVVIALTE